MMKEIWIFPVQCIVAFSVILRIKNVFSLQTASSDLLCTDEAVCFLSSSNRFFECYLDKFQV